MKGLLMGLLILSILAAGCWDVRDIDNKAFVSAVGLDLPEDITKNYKVTLEFYDPKELKNQESKKPTLIEIVEAESIGQGVEEIQARMSRDITFDHLRLIFIGGKLAQSRDFRELINYFEKNSEVALRLRLGFIQDATASEALQSDPRLADSVSDKYIRMTQLKKDISIARTNTFYNLLGDLRENKGVAFGPRIVVSGDYIIRHGGVIFADYKLKGFLSAEETREANWLTGTSQTTVVGKSNDGIYTYEVAKRKLTIIPTLTNGNLEFTVHLRTDGNIIEEKGKDSDLSKPANIKKMEDLFSKVITRQINGALSKSQDFFKVDYLGFGKKLYQKDPETFKSLNWKEQFPNIPINVLVEAKVSRFGLAK